MSNQIAEILNDIQYRTGKSLSQIADEIGYSRPHLSKEKNKGDNEHLLGVLKVKYANVLRQESENNAGTVPAERLIQVLEEQNEFLRRNLETSLKSILEGQHQNGVQLKALSWYSALVASGGDPKKADQEVLKIHNKIASYEGVKGEDDSSSEGGKRRTSVKK